MLNIKWPHASYDI